MHPQSASTCQSAERDSSALGPARAADSAGARGGTSPERAHGFSGALWRTPLCRLSARRTLRDSSKPGLDHNFRRRGAKTDRGMLPALQDTLSC